MQLDTRTVSVSANLTHVKLRMRAKEKQVLEIALFFYPRAIEFPILKGFKKEAKNNISCVISEDKVSDERREFG